MNRLFQQLNGGVPEQARQMASLFKGAKNPVRLENKLWGTIDRTVPAEKRMSNECRTKTRKAPNHATYRH